MSEGNTENKEPLLDINGKYQGDDRALLGGKRFEEELDVLNRQQINQCLMNIMEMHPMRTRIKYDDILPPLKNLRRCFGKKKPEFDYGLRKALMTKMGFHVNKSDGEIAEHPWLLLGYGINAFFDIM